MDLNKNFAYTAFRGYFLDNVVTGEESWTFQYDPETKAQSSEWHTPASPESKNVKVPRQDNADCVFRQAGVNSQRVCPSG